METSRNHQNSTCILQHRCNHCNHTVLSSEGNCSVWERLQSFPTCQLSQAVHVIMARPCRSTQRRGRAACVYSSCYVHVMSRLSACLLLSSYACPVDAWQTANRLSPLSKGLLPSMLFVLDVTLIFLTQFIIFFPFQLSNTEVISGSLSRSLSQMLDVLFCLAAGYKFVHVKMFCILRKAWSEFASDQSSALSQIVLNCKSIRSKKIFEAHLVWIVQVCESP